jgi:Skp family chaperone for outer membrane proteins
MQRQRDMLHLHQAVLTIALLGASWCAQAVQDPKAASAQLEHRLNAVNGEITKVSGQLANPKLQPNERRALQAKQNALAKEQRALANDRARNQHLADNPMVLYGDD